MMIYSIGFKRQGILQSRNGYKYIHIDDDGGAFLKELCGEYPSRWDCRSVDYMLPIFEQALERLRSEENKTEFESYFEGKFSNYNEIAFTLEQLITWCKTYPDAIMEVDW